MSYLLLLSSVPSSHYDQYIRIQCFSNTVPTTSNGFTPTRVTNELLWGLKIYLNEKSQGVQQTGDKSTYIELQWSKINILKLPWDRFHNKQQHAVEIPISVYAIFNKARFKINRIIDASNKFLKRASPIARAYNGI